MPEPVRKSRPVGGGTTSYLDWENERPQLHFTHANGFNAQTYKSLLAPLSGHFHITAHDLRGHGFTRLATPEGFAKDWTIFRDDLIALLDSFGSGPMLLAGHSMGSVASLMVAAARPDLVAGLVLVEPVFLPLLPSFLFRLAQLGRKGDMSLVERAAKRRAEFDSVEAMQASYRGRGAFKHWPDDMLHDYVIGGTQPTAAGHIRLACSPQVEAACFAASPRGAYRYASGVRCPTTLIHGEGPDSSCQPMQVRAFTRRKPDARIVAVKDVGHFLPMERPQIVREEIRRLGDMVMPRP